MPGWINKIFGGTTQTTTSVRSTAADVPAGWGSQLLELLKPLDQQIRPGTARDLVNFVLIVRRSCSPSATPISS